MKKIVAVLALISMSAVPLRGMAQHSFFSKVDGLFYGGLFAGATGLASLALFAEWVSGKLCKNSKHKIKERANAIINNPSLSDDTIPEFCLHAISGVANSSFYDAQRRELAKAALSALYSIAYSLHEKTNDPFAEKMLAFINDDVAIDLSIQRPYQQRVFLKTAIALKAYLRSKPYAIVPSSSSLKAWGFSLFFAAGASVITYFFYRDLKNIFPESYTSLVKVQKRINPLFLAELTVKAILPLSIMAITLIKMTPQQRTEKFLDDSIAKLLDGIDSVKAV